MQVQAVMKYVRLSPLKARDFARRIQGLPVPQALALTGASQRKAGRLLDKALRSAVANAENNANTSAETLRIREAVVEQGPALKRWWPRSRGMARPIKHRLSHIRITLSDEGI